ncbi:sodium-coupled monocarboxylate transporter 2-like [Mercenaria mercenaria]|uniref:sodium-coupled monocarboxylate transporter 2-like n=1 Tax=Mercenaria mercenaria TaxID=6596 RepID=UPI00234F3859|nr:sodium-coupled monocarboxylate transporter 2-like [Mercenaria mercenaria]
MTGDYSIYTGDKRTLRILDYILFSLLFIASAGIGFYHAYRDRKNTNVDNFHLGGRKMHPLPVSLSLAATFMSALTILGTPAEVYTFGTMFYWIVLGMFIATAGTAHVFLPVFYHMNKISCFGYLQLRFGNMTRLLASFLFLLQTLLYMGFVLYAPSLAFQAVTGLSLWGSMIGVASVCTLYTMLGGMKTVLWTNCLQLVIMIIGLLALLIEGSNATGGIAKVWEIAKEQGRIEFNNISVDPRTRHTVWSVGIGGAMFWTYLYGINQAQVQRECSLPTLRRSQLAVWLNFLGLLLINTLVCLIGVVMYAFYSECDPVKFGLVDKTDQLVPLMVLDVLGTIPGFPGIFMACVFSGTLSSLSSGLNAMSAVIIEDYIKCFCFKSLTGHTNPKTINKRLMSPLFYMLCPCLPDKMRIPMRFGVDYEKTDVCNKQDRTMRSTGNGNMAYIEDSPL